ncbi:MAG TPA: DUF4168 domain-containing protein [Gammaproteobacteria bacterium]|nr:DUF4168 domain-containing protein [Gammaproteobacteria bacterium]
MKTSTLTMLAVGAVAAFAAAPVSFAQQSETVAPATEPTTVSDADLETFALIYVDLLDTVDKFRAEIEAVQTEEQALGIRERMQTESIAKVAQRGWTPEKFNSIGDAINRDPGLAEKAASLIEKE